MSDSPLNSPDRREMERVARDFLGRQLRMLVGLSLLLLVIGFVMGQFTGALLARRNTERLQGQLDEVQGTLARLEQQLAEQDQAHQRLDEIIAGIERRHNEELAADQEEPVQEQADPEDRIVSDSSTTPGVHEKLDGEAADEHVDSIGEFLTTHVRRLGMQETLSVSFVTCEEEPTADSSPEVSPEVDCETTSYVEGPEWRAPANAISPPTSRPSPGLDASTTEGNAAGEGSHTRRHGLLFFSPSQPRRIEPTELSDSDVIPLPPR